MFPSLSQTKVAWPHTIQKGYDFIPTTHTLSTSVFPWKSISLLRFLKLNMSLSVVQGSGQHFINPTIRKQHLSPTHTLIVWWKTFFFFFWHENVSYRYKRDYALFTLNEVAHTENLALNDNGVQKSNSLAQHAGPSGP